MASKATFNNRRFNAHVIISLLAFFSGAEGSLRIRPGQHPLAPIAENTNQAQNKPAQSLTPDEFLASLSSKLIDYVDGQKDTSKPTVKFAGPQRIHREFENAGCPLAVGTEAVDAREILKACDAIMEYSVRTSSPLFNNQLYGASDPVAIAGDWMAAALNPSAYTYEVAPVFSLMETELIQKLGSMLGGDFSHKRKVDGLFVPGGSMSNMYALQVARFRACPDIKSKGNAAVPGLCAFVSDEAHYSYQKACGLLGIGTESGLVKVPTDPNTGAMDAQALKRLLYEARAQGRRPFFVGCTAGTTVLGAYDPFLEVKAVIDEFNAEAFELSGQDCAVVDGVHSYDQAQGHPGVWMHVDGAWGGGAVFSKRERAKCLVGAECADSFCTNPHKLLGAPQQCCCFMTRHPNLIMGANAASAAYLFQPDKENGDLDYGDKTVQCGRKVDTLKLWLLWKYLGDEGLEKRVDGLCDMAIHMSHRIANTLDEQGRRCFVQVTPTSLTNVVFYAIPPSMRVDPVHAGIDPLDDNALLERLDMEMLAKVAPPVKAAMQRAGEALITFQPVKRFPNCWRMVFAGAKDVAGMTFETVDQILDSMRGHVEGLFPETQFCEA